MRHGLEHRHAETLHERRITHHTCPGINCRQIYVGHVPSKHHTWGHRQSCSEIIITPARSPHHHERWHRGAQCCMCVEQSRQVFAWLECADEQQILRWECVALSHIGNLRRIRRTKSHTEWHEPQTLGQKPVAETVIQRGARRTQHQSGALTNDVQRPRKHVATAGSEILRMMQEGQVVHGHHQGHVRRTGERNDARGVQHIDWPRGTFDAWPTESQRRLDEQWASQRQLSNSNCRLVTGGGRPTMTTSHTDDIGIVACRQCAAELDCSNTGATRRLAPALLEGERHAHSTHCLYSVGARAACRRIRWKHRDGAS